MVMIAGILASLVVFLLLLVAEKLRRSKRLRPEVTRKFIHITVGSFVAVWPFFMPRWAILGICIAFIIVILAARIKKALPSIHSVQRKTWGDLLFPVGIATVALIANNKWIFAASMLHLSLADGFAALLGDKYGKKNSYKILGYKKTIAGNIGFLFISALIMSWLIWLTPAGLEQIGLAGVVILPIISTLTEAVAVGGTDNLLVPIGLTVLLNALQLI